MTDGATTGAAVETEEIDMNSEHRPPQAHNPAGEDHTGRQKAPGKRTLSVTENAQLQHKRLHSWQEAKTNQNCPFSIRKMSGLAGFSM